RPTPFGTRGQALDQAQDEQDRRRGQADAGVGRDERHRQDRKSTRLNSSHVKNSYAVFCLKKKISSELRFVIISDSSFLFSFISYLFFSVIFFFFVLSSFLYDCSFFFILRRLRRSTLFPYTTLFRSRPTPFGTRGQALDQAQDEQDRRRGQADAGVGRDERHRHRGQAHRQEGRDQHSFAAEPVTEVPADHRAQRAHDEADGERGQGAELAGHRVAGREELRPEHQHRGEPVQREVVE